MRVYKNVTSSRTVFRNSEVSLPTHCTVLAVINHSIQDLGKLLEAKIILKPRNTETSVFKGFQLYAPWSEVFV